MRHDSNAPRRFYINGELAQETPTQQQQGGAGGRQPSYRMPNGQQIWTPPQQPPMGQPGQPPTQHNGGFFSGGGINGGPMAPAYPIPANQQGGGGFVGGIPRPGGMIAGAQGMSPAQQAWAGIGFNPQPLTASSLSQGNGFQNQNPAQPVGTGGQFGMRQQSQSQLQSQLQSQNAALMARILRGG